MFAADGAFVTDSINVGNFDVVEGVVVDGVVDVDVVVEGVVVVVVVVVVVAGTGLGSNEATTSASILCVLFSCLK